MKKPRIYGGYQTTVPSYFREGTWLEEEEWAYPAGGFTRRACAMFPDGKIRVVKCSIPDTFFSIPARVVEHGKKVKGFLVVEEKILKFYYEKGG